MYRLARRISNMISCNIENSWISKKKKKTVKRKRKVQKFRFLFFKRFAYMCIPVEIQFQGIRAYKITQEGSRWYSGRRFLSHRVFCSHAQTLHDNVIPFNPAEPRKPWDAAACCRCSLDPRASCIGRKRLSLVSVVIGDFSNYEPTIKKKHVNSSVITHNAPHMALENDILFIP